ncbi:MAG: glycosyltransferase [Candidatus Symbiothrix sp.]|jgi:glycosyltransferase involved in cell wall biosynthesis|nr:glycosyltransferase [Candidatus Symbiothrix sp.]
MKILQINKYFYHKGGSESVFFNTIDLLKEHGHEVHCLAIKNPKNLLSDDSSYFIDYPEMSETGFVGKLKNSLAFFYNREAKKKIEQLIRNQQPDVAHIHLLFNGLSVSILPVLKKYNIPVVMTVHDYRLLCPAYLFLDGSGTICEKCRDGHYGHCIQKKCSRRGHIIDTMLCLDMYFRNLCFPIHKYVDKFIFISNFTFDKHADYNPIYKEKGVRLYNFVKPVEINSTNAQASPEKYYLYYGRLSREKGLLTLVDAVKNMNIKLKIAGIGNALDYILDLPQNIEILGFKTGVELQDLIRNAYFVIVPSEWYETFGLTVVEPQVLGVPVIGARIGAIPELIKENENGFLFEVGNAVALRQAIEKAEKCSAKQYEQMSLNARTASVQFSDSESAYNQLITIYHL